MTKRLNDAYALDDYAAAKHALNGLHRELMDFTPSAARSLAEGMEETLTVHRLHIPPLLRQTLASTNIIESVFSVVEKVCANVKRWHPGDQRERWVGSGLLVSEKQFRRVKGHKLIPLLLRQMETSCVFQRCGYQKEESLVKWVTRDTLLSTERRAIPEIQ